MTGFAICSIFTLTEIFGILTEKPKILWNDLSIGVGVGFGSKTRQDLGDRFSEMNGFRWKVSTIRLTSLNDIERRRTNEAMKSDLKNEIFSEDFLIVGRNCKIKLKSVLTWMDKMGWYVWSECNCKRLRETCCRDREWNKECKRDLVRGERMCVWERERWRRKNSPKFSAHKYRLRRKVFFTSSFSSQASWLLWLN